MAQITISKDEYIKSLEIEREKIMKRAKEITVLIRKAKLPPPPITRAEMSERRAKTARRMFQMRSSGSTLKCIAAEFGVSSTRVSEQLFWYEKRGIE